MKPSPIWLTARAFALSAYLIFALFPLYWIIKIAVTPNKALYSEALRAWPSSVTLENFGSVLPPRHFRLTSPTA